MALSITLEKGIEFTSYKTIGQQKGSTGTWSLAGGFGIGLLGGSQSDFLGTAKEKFATAGIGFENVGFSSIETSSGQKGFGVGVMGIGLGFSSGSRETNTCH